MRGAFLALHARAFCHATENLDKVKLALTNIVGHTEIAVSKSEGYYGNPIAILESTVDDQEDILKFFKRLSTSDLDELSRSLISRIDDGCNLFIRIDKQSAYGGAVQLGRNDDIVSVRLRVRAFPAKCEVARNIADEFISSILADRKQD